MKKIACVLMVFMCAALAGCATTGLKIQEESQAACEDQKIAKFTDLLQCTWQGMKDKKPDILENKRILKYMQQGVELAILNESNIITDASAREAWSGLKGIETEFIKKDEEIASAQTREKVLGVIGDIAKGLVVGAAVGLSAGAMMAGPPMQPYYPPPPPRYGYGYAGYNYQQPTQTRCHTSVNGYTQCQTW